MKIVQLITDNREPFREYEKEMPWFGTAPEALLQGFATMPELEVHVVSCTKKPMKASPKKLAENIYFHSLVVPHIGWLRTGYQGCIRAVRSKLRELRPDVVHGQGSERDQNISAVFSGFPNVVTIHGNMAAIARQFKAKPGTFVWLAGMLENFTLPRAGGVLCNSEYTESLVRPRNSRTWRVPNPLRDAFFVPIPERPPGARPRLVNVGVISPRKRQVELLAMFRRLHEKGHPFQIDFVGLAEKHVPYAQTFLRDIEHATEHGYGFYSGVKDVEPLRESLDQADGCIHYPSEEAFGLIVAEALSRNLKLFASREGGIVDISTGVDGAELIARDDFAGLENALLRWKEAGWPRPVQAAQVMVDRYHPTVIARKHLEIYREVMAKPKR